MKRLREKLTALQANTYAASSDAILKADKKP